MDKHIKERCAICSRDFNLPVHVLDWISQNCRREWTVYPWFCDRCLGKLGIRAT